MEAQNTQDTDSPRRRSIAVREGRREFEIEQSDEEERGAIKAIRALSAEVCDRCAKTGDLVEDEAGKTGRRYRTLRVPEQRTRPPTRE